MKKYLPIILISLQGCGVLECIDSKFEREAKPIDKKFVVNLNYRDMETQTKVIHCEEYYDAMCAERGNYWAIREVGLKNQYQTSSFKFIDAELGSIKYPVPTCQTLVENKKLSYKNLLPQIAEQTYFLKSSSGNQRTYATPKRKGVAQKEIQVELTVTINNVPLI